MVDSDLARGGHQNLERRAVGYRQRQMVQSVVGRLTCDGSRGTGALVSTTTNLPPRCRTATYPMSGSSAKGTRPSTALYHLALAPTSETSSCTCESPVMGALRTVFVPRGHATDPS